MASIVRVEPSRGNTVIHVVYNYKNIQMENDFSVTKDSFKVKDIVLIKVAKKYPEKSIEFVRRLH